MADQLRYGVFLRPDPATCLAVTTITGAIRAQYGLVSAGAFPPHATLAGSLPLAGSAEEPEAHLLAALDLALAGVGAFNVHNSGVDRLGNAVVYDLDTVGTVPNEPLHSLARRVDAAAAPLLDPAPVGRPADSYLPGRWRGHLSLASHELDSRPELGAEVLAFARGLPVSVPNRWPADTVILYRLAHPTWTGPWWRSISWEHVRSWPLGPGAPATSGP